MYKNKIINLLKNKTDYNHITFSGRANTLIWNLGVYLKKKFKKPKILIPSQMCVSPAIIFKLLKIDVEYIDANYKTGLIDSRLIRSKIKKKNINCIFFVNLFGNTCRKEVFRFVQKKGIIVIQDLAQTFISNKKKINENELFGDIILLSFGYSKIFEIGQGSIM